MKEKLPVKRNFGLFSTEKPEEAAQSRRAFVPLAIEHGLQ
jgi:hypothetical protein